MSTGSTQRLLLLLVLSCTTWLGPLLPVSVAVAQDEFDELDESGSDESDSEATDDDQGAVDEDGDEGAETGDAAPQPSSDVSVQVFAGAGVGTRALLRPILGMGVQRMDDVAFAALDAGLRVTVWPAETFSWEFLLRYATSLGMTVEQQPRFAPVNGVDVRANHVELSVAPEFHLGDAASSASLLFPVGFGLRTLWPEVHSLPVPGYTLGGPLLRAELAIPFLDVVTLRFGPEVQWIVMIDQSIVDDGAGYQAVALGGEALLRAQVTTFLGIELAFRESHALAPTSVAGENFVDIERFFTGRMSGTW